MFFHMVLERNLLLHPRYFGPHLRENLVMKLMKDVEGTCSRRHGFVVAITAVDGIGMERSVRELDLSLSPSDINVFCSGRLKGRFLRPLSLWSIRFELFSVTYFFEI
ncbi:hypothetical protein ZOSMA_462G00120 [Zostera marina]|uniref:RNA polymerase Rpb7-like N-terminal domain-containing protein n=1 Tax=Zostera marina TaxID=29655 RepID=A0A0K9P0E0_ZOSMR|nr:hypothetical protein ZOSMA_462G00120 [Zostera marina]